MRVTVTFSGREASITEPIETAGGTVTDTNPDVLVTDDPPRDRANVPVVYRPRTDILRYYQSRRFGRLRGFFRILRSSAYLDGIAAPDPIVARKLRTITSVPVRTIPLAKDPTDWIVNHDTGHMTQLLTLTNLDYRRKTDPLIERLPQVNQWCENHGGKWAIAGQGKYSKRLQEATEGYSHVDWIGYVAPNPWLESSDILVHFSELDIQHPNAILEGFCSGLPVITNNYIPFTEAKRIEATGNVRKTLSKYADESRRKQTGTDNRQYVEYNHSPEDIGTQWRDFLERIT